MIKRYLTLRVIVIVTTLLFLVAIYFGTRKILALDIELGMSREAVHRILGKPVDDETMIWNSSYAEVWELVLFMSRVYNRVLVVDYDLAGNVIYIAVIHEVCGRRFQLVSQ